MKQELHPLLKFFSYEHLPKKLQEVSRPFYILAAKLDSELPGSAEKTVALRKLLESKDCAVRATLELEVVAPKVSVAGRDYTTKDNPYGYRMRYNPDLGVGS